MPSVRDSLTPLNTALGNSPTMFVQASFVGLPLINQALAALNPIGPNSFFVTVQGLIQVVGSIPISDVVKAVAIANAPHPPPPPPPHAPTHPPPPPGAPPVTCGAELDTSDPGGEATTNERIFGSGFVGGETVVVIEGATVIAMTSATAGQFSVSVGFIHATLPTAHTVHAQGIMSGRISNSTSFTT